MGLDWDSGNRPAAREKLLSRGHRYPERHLRTHRRVRTWTAASYGHFRRCSWAHVHVRGTCTSLRMKLFIQFLAYAQLHAPIHVHAAYPFLHVRMQVYSFSYKSCAQAGLPIWWNV